MNQDLAGLSGRARVAGSTGSARVALTSAYAISTTQTTCARGSRIASCSGRSAGAEFGVTVEVAPYKVLVEQEHVATVGSFSAITAAAAIPAITTGGTQRWIFAAASASAVTATPARTAGLAATTVAATSALIRACDVADQVSYPDRQVKRLRGITTAPAPSSVGASTAGFANGRLVVAVPVALGGRPVRALSARAARCPPRAERPACRDDLECGHSLSPIRAYAVVQ